MNFEEYMLTVAKRCKELPYREHLAHMAMGVTGEFGEVVEMIKKHTIYGKPLDRKGLIREVGDICWYVTGFAWKLNVPSHFLEVGVSFGTTVRLPAPDTEFMVAITSLAATNAASLIETEEGNIEAAYESILILAELVGMVCGRFNLDIEEVLAVNDAKLAARYDQAFDAKQAIDRKDVNMDPIMGGVQPTTFASTATVGPATVAAKWDGHGTARQSNTGPGPSPETEAYWEDKHRKLVTHNANDKDTPRMKP